MDNRKYRNFFYYTDKGYPSYFSKELQSSLILEFKLILDRQPGVVSREYYLTVLKIFLEDSIKLLKYYKIRKDRIESFIKNLTTTLITDCPKQGKGLSKGFFSKAKKFIDVDEIFKFETDFTKQWHEDIDKQFEFQFKELNKKVTTNKLAIYLSILGFESTDNINSSTIKKRFNKLAMTKHPDHGGDRDEFIAITEAKDYLLGVFNE